MLGEGFAGKLWKRFRLRNLSYSDRYGAINSLYRVEDPWEMVSAKEQARFRATNELIEREFGRVNTLLEIGCGEGHQSVHLAQLADRLVGLDVSERAVERARHRCPACSFEVAELLKWSPEPEERFDLVTACEVLYYVKNIHAAIERIRVLGKAAVITYYDKQAGELSSALESLGDAVCGTFSFSGTTWHTRVFRFDE